MAISGTVTLGFDITEVASPDIGSATGRVAPSWVKTLTNGTGIDQANKIFVDSVTLAGSAAQSYDLDGAALVGVLGQVMGAFSRIYGVFIRRTDAPAASTQDENLLIGGDFILTKYLIPGADTLSAVTIPVHPGGCFAFIAPNATGVAVTASTGDVITITNASSADSCTFEIVILAS